MSREEKDPITINVKFSNDLRLDRVFENALKKGLKLKKNTTIEMPTATYPFGTMQLEDNVTLNFLKDNDRAPQSSSDFPLVSGEYKKDSVSGDQGKKSPVSVEEQNKREDVAAQQLCSLVKAGAANANLQADQHALSEKNTAQAKAATEAALEKAVGEWEKVDAPTDTKRSVFSPEVKHPIEPGDDGAEMKTQQRFGANQPNAAASPTTTGPKRPPTKLSSSIFGFFKKPTHEPPASKVKADNEEELKTRQNFGK